MTGVRNQNRDSAVVTTFAAQAGDIGLGAPIRMSAGRGFAAAVAELLNLTLYSQTIPVWVFGVQAAAGLLVPLLVALGPIARGSRITVREAIQDFGVSQERTGGRGLGALRSGLDRTLLLALRNTFRRRGRLVLTVGLLAAGGAMFMTGLNVREENAQTGQVVLITLDLSLIILFLVAFIALKGRRQNKELSIPVWALLTFVLVQVSFLI